MGEPKFDPNQGFAKVIGDAGDYYVQGGNVFNLAGRFLRSDSKGESPKPKVVGQTWKPQDPPLVKAATEPEAKPKTGMTWGDVDAKWAQVDADRESIAAELDQKHWRTLKRMVEAAGGHYEDKAQAIDFLARVQAV